MKKKSIFIVLFAFTVLLLVACSGGTTKTGVSEDIIGHWRCEETEELMEHFSEDMHFYGDGSFESSTWREQNKGTYTVVGNEITVKYDFYFNPAGSTEYTYENSGTKTFELKDGKLKLTKNVLDDGTAYEDRKEYIKVK